MVKKWNLPGYKRFWYLFSTYARSYWKIFVALVILNLFIFVLASIQTVFTAATIDALTGHYEDPASLEMQRAPVTIAGLSLNNIGSVAYKWLGIGETSNQFKQVMFAGVLSLGTELVIAVATFFATWLGSYVSQKTSNQVQISLFRHYMNFSMKFFNKNKAGQLISRMENDTAGATGGYQSLINSFVVCPLTIIFFSFLIIKASWVLFLAVIVAGFSHHFLSITLSKPIHKNTKAGYNLNANYRSTLMEAFAAIRVVKSFAAEGFEIARIKNGIEEIFKNKMTSTKLNNIQSQGRKIINGMVRIIILSFAAYELYVTHRINLSSCLLFVFLCNQVISPIAQISGAYLTLQTMIASSQRVYRYFRMEPEILDGVRSVEKVEKGITLQKISFSYEKKLILHSVDVSINKGETVAFVGPSGAGKSTLMDLLLRFYDPKEGRILLDGVDIREFKQKDYRKLFGVVSQESILFNATIRDNIAYGRDMISQAQIEAAARIANAHDFILDTEYGYDTYVGDRGIRLSGGQRQRIAIARAVAGSPQILVLDEATSSLDSESEKEVQQAINKVTQNMTAFIIAHRLSTILHAHKIVVLEKGHVVDCGSHQTLLGRCPLYQTLYHHQFEAQKILI